MLRNEQPLLDYNSSHHLFYEILYELNERKAMVVRIERITITTISSTGVKAEWGLCISEV